MKTVFSAIKIRTAMTLCTKLQCRKITQNIIPWVTFELEAGVYTIACYVSLKAILAFKIKVLFRIAIFFNIFFKMMSLEILTMPSFCILNFHHKSLKTHDSLVSWWNFMMWNGMRWICKRLERVTIKKH